MPKPVSATAQAKKSAAQWGCERGVLYLKSFDEQLNRDQALAMGFVGGGVGVLRMQLVEHVTPLNVALRALFKGDPAKSANRIGFRPVQDLEDETGAGTGKNTRYRDL